MSQTVWFVSDLHFGHANVIQYCNRPWAGRGASWIDMDTDEPATDVKVMDLELIDNWNRRVAKSDLIYILGDFCLAKPEYATQIVKKLHGQKYLIFGNHDKQLRKDMTFLGHFIWAKDYAEIKVQNQKIILSHYAMLTWNQSHRGSWQLHGHSHGSLPDDPNALRLDIGVDVPWTDYGPVSFEQVKEKMAEKTWKAIDHHTQRDL